MHDFKVTKSRLTHWLTLRVWCDDTYHVHTEWPLCEIHTGEIDFIAGSRGGRFRHYRHDVRGNCVRVTFFSYSKLDRLLLWLYENATADWSLDFEPHERINVGGGIPSMCGGTDLLFHFDHADDAILFLLTFA